MNTTHKSKQNKVWHSTKKTAASASKKNNLSMISSTSQRGELSTKSECMGWVMVWAKLPLNTWLPLNKIVELFKIMHCSIWKITMDIDKVQKWPVNYTILRLTAKCRVVAETGDPNTNYRMYTLLWDETFADFTDWQLCAKIFKSSKL